MTAKCDINIDYILIILTPILTRPWKQISKSEMKRGEGAKFTFHFLASKQFDSLENRDARDCLLKWFATITLNSRKGI